MRRAGEEAKQARWHWRKRTNREKPLVNSNFHMSDLLATLSKNGMAAVYFALASPFCRKLIINLARAQTVTISVMFHSCTVAYFSISPWTTCRPYSYPIMLSSSVGSFRGKKSVFPAAMPQSRSCTEQQQSGTPADGNNIKGLCFPTL